MAHCTPPTLPAAPSRRYVPVMLLDRSPQVPYTIELQQVYVAALLMADVLLLLKRLFPGVTGLLKRVHASSALWAGSNCLRNVVGRPEQRRRWRPVWQTHGWGTCEVQRFDGNSTVKEKVKIMYN